MSTSQSGQPEFSGLRLYLWPIHRHELKKLLPMLLIFFFISFDYNVLRTLKDTLVLYAPASGAEVIPFIKVWAMFPGTLLMTFLFTRLSNKFSRQTVSYIFISFFLAYFFLFVSLIYPNRDALEPTTLTTTLQQLLPESFKWPILMFRNWIFTSFYVMSELWSNIIFFIIIWGFANQITRLNEAKRFYGLFGVGANFSGILAGQASVFLNKFNFGSGTLSSTEKWEQSMVMLVSMVIVAGILVLFLLRWMEKHVLSDPIYYDPAEVKAEGRVQGKLSMRESFKYLFRSRYLIFLAVIVLSYNVVINLTEVIWKFEVHELYHNASEYNIYMNQVSTVIAIFATVSAMFISGNAIRIFGWTFTAMITPFILMTTSMAFFSFFFLKSYSPDPTAYLMGLTPLAMIVFVGTSQNVMCRAAKYSVFDATKEMAFVPLSPECKLNGKAAIDGVCSRLGKTGGSLIHQALLLSLASFTASAPYVAILLFVIIALWMIAVRIVGKDFSDLTSPTETLQAPVQPQPLQELREEGASV